VTLLLAVGGSFDPRASGALADAGHPADAYNPESSTAILTQTNP
jgi:hypothetical protein